jgi:hypothetical protein
MTQQQQHQSPVAGGSFAELSALCSLIREERKHSARLLQEWESKMERQRAALEAKIDQLVQDSRPLRAQQAVPDELLDAVQSRLHALHEAALLTEQETHAAEDAIADCVAAMAENETISADHSLVVRVVKMIALCERIKSNAALARQMRRVAAVSA